MVEAQELPAAFAARHPVRSRRAKLAGVGAGRMVANGLAFDSAVEASGAARRFGGFDGNDATFLEVCRL